jgi:hypothetical protein
MKEETYNKLVLKLGVEKADILKKAMEKANKEKEAIEKWNKVRDKKLLEVGIKKEELEDCTYYHGIRFRGHGIAQWDEKIGKFLILAYEWNLPVIEQLEHFADVIENGYDGFVPIEKIDKNKYYDIRQMDPKKIEEEIKNRKLE